MRDLEYMLERISLWEKLPVLLLDAEDQVIPWRDNILDVEGWYGENPDLMDLLLHYLNGHRQTIYQEQEIFAYAAVEDEETGERCILGPVVLEKNFHGSLRNYRNVGVPAGGWEAALCFSGISDQLRGTSLFCDLP